MRVKCLAQEHNTMSPARARTRTARSGVERTNHEATAPPEKKHNIMYTDKHIPRANVVLPRNKYALLSKNKSSQTH